MPASDTSTTTTPTLPAVSPATQTAYNAANKAVEESLKISPDELSTQADIDKLIESTKAGYRATSDQPIPMEFITGQLASIERRATGLAEPLERKLSRLQAARTASLEASKFKLERTADQLKIEREASQKAKEEAESARRFGITTGLTEKTQAQSKLEADRKFEEDKRQFGLDYAIKQREIAVKERETAIKETEAKGATGVTPEAGSALQLISEILPNAKAVSGAFQTGMIPFTAGKVTKNKLNQLNAILAIGARKLIKGQGQVSDYEAKILQQSTNALSSGLSESAFAEELKRMRGILNANAGFPVMVQIVQNGKVVDEGTLSREDIFDAASKGYQIKYQ
ncbi:hypothetical protein HY967_01600 [Candidatus Jorgensenbacteria bacterium]|nr:hypothetical protein [Candidatus Jorgensenbacteria bacterium]